MATRTTAFAGALLLLLVACGTEDGEPQPHADVTAAEATVALVDETVRLTVAVDGTTVVDDDFHVEGQHTWIYFPLALPPGDRHEVVAETDSGVGLSTSLTLPATGKRRALIDYWTDSDRPPYLAWQVFDAPPAFA